MWQARGYLYEGDERLTQALAMPGGQDALRAKAIEALGGIKWWRGMMDDCLVLYEEALEMQREIANALYNLGLIVAFHSQEWDRGRETILEARDIYLRLEDTDGLGDAAWGMGNTYMNEADGDNLLTWFKEATKYYRQSGNDFSLGWSNFEVGAYYERAGEYAEGWPYLRDAMALFGSHRDVSGVVLVGAELAGVALGLGDALRAYRLAGMAMHWRDASGADIGTLEFNVPPGLEPETLLSLEGEAGEAFEEGRRATLEAFVEYALAGPIDDGG